MALFLLTALALGYLATQHTAQHLIFGLVAVAIFAVAFINIEIGLYILILSMLLSPEIIVGGTGGASLGRGVTLRFEDFLLFVIGMSWFARNAVEKDIGLFLRTPLNRGIFFYLLACVLATGFGVMAGRVGPKTGFFFVIKYFEYFIVYFMVVNHLKSREQVRRLVFFLFVTCFIVSIIGILQIPGGGRVSAPFEGAQGEPNTFGGYLVFIGAMAVGLFIHHPDRRVRQMLLLLIVTIIPPLFFTQSRSSYLAVLPVLFTLAFFQKRRVIAVGLVFIFVGFSPFLLPHVVKERIMYTITQPEEQGQMAVGDVRIDTSTTARLVSWREAVQDWVKRPILGYGVTGYKFVDAQYPRVIAETGILGLMAFLYLLYSIWRVAWRGVTELQDPFHRGLALGYIAGFVGMLVHAIGANTFIIVRIMEPFWFFTGIMVLLPVLEASRGELPDAS